MLPKIKRQKFRQLTEIVLTKGGVETGYPDRLLRAARLFFKKHPDWITKVFKGTKSHVRTDEIVRKMKLFGLNAGDVEVVHQALINGDVVSKPSSILKGD